MSVHACLSPLDIKLICLHLRLQRVFRWAATPITQQLHNGGTGSDVDLTLVQAMTQMADQKLFMVHQ